MYCDNCTDDYKILIPIKREWTYNRDGSEEERTGIDNKLWCAKCIFKEMLE